ncbi:MAG: hypothetical protein RL757_3394 [Bacteroidota bacterium]|jgi:hypothetical protein
MKNFVCESKKTTPQYKTAFCKKKILAQHVREDFFLQKFIF